jgi:small glutamine-rich tetratricopeptide repeat-containing protein alpha
MAVDDAKKAISLDASYAKAYSRLGHALFCMERYSEAVAAYEKGVKLDPSNKAMKDQLNKAKEMDTSAPSPAAGAGAGGLGGLASMLGGMGGAGGMPDLSSMLGGMGGAGGMPDLGSLMSNPMLQQAAEMVRNNPAMLQNMMSNPMFQQMAGSMMGRGAGGAGGAASGAGAGGMPDISSLLNNPDLMNAAASLMGRGRGAPPP